MPHLVDDQSRLGTVPSVPLQTLPPDFHWPKDRPGEARVEARPAASGAVRWRAWLFALVGMATAAWVYLAPPPEGLTAAGQAAFAVLLVAATLWMTELLPIGVTGLLSVALLVLLEAMHPAEAYAAFGNSAVFFILAVFILSAALIHTGLSKRLALAFLQRLDHGAFSLAAGIMATTAFLTLWMPAQATAAMLLPITVEIARAMRLTPGASPYGRALLLSLAWGAMIGSNASFLGSTRAPLAMGMLESAYGQTISFSQWLLASAPVVVLGLGIGIGVLRFAFPRERVDVRSARELIAAAVADLGPLGSSQLRVLAILGVTIPGWVVLGGTIDLAAMALLAAVLLFACGVLRWQDLEGYVNWGIILMYGGAIALGVAIDRSGAAEWLVRGMVDGVHLSPHATVAGLMVTTVLLSQVMSNAAAVAVMLPLGFGLAQQFGVSPLTAVFACSFAAGLDFTFPFSSAPSTIAFSSGYIRMRDMLVVGTLMTALQIGLLLLIARLYWPLVGLM